MGARGQSASPAAPAVRVEAGRASRRLREVGGSWRVPRCFPQAAPGQRVPRCSGGPVRGPWPGCCVERELRALGPACWGGSAAPPTAPGGAGGWLRAWPSRRASGTAWVKAHLCSGRCSAPALGRPLMSCRVPGSGGQCQSLPGGSPALVFPCVQHHWGRRHPVEPRRCVSGGAAPALPQGLGRRKQERVNGEGWCGASAPGQPRKVPAVISVLAQSR